MLKKSNAVLLMMVLAFMLVLSACGQAATSTTADTGNTATTETTTAAEPAAEEPATEPAAEEPAATEGEMVTFQSDAGEVQVPKNPQRIVDLTAFTAGYFVALDAPLVGTTSGAINNKYIKEQLAAQGTVDLGETPTAEPILALQPDLIIVYQGTEGVEQLAEIAPVVQIAYGKDHFKDLMVKLGTLTNREDAAKAWVEQWNTKIAELKPQIEETLGDRTVSLINPYEKGIYIFGHNYGRGGEIIYSEFGLKAPEKAQAEAIDSGTGFASISLEVLPEYAGDIIFTSPWSGDTSDPEIVYGNSIWANLPAVKAGHVFQLDATSDTYNDPMTLEGQLKFVTDSLLSAK